MAHKNYAIQKILEDRYYLRDEQGNLLENDPLSMFNRVALAIAKAEGEDHRKVDAWFLKFYALMAENKFLPNTPTLINAGKDRPGCFSACFVLPVPDSMEGIFEAVKQSALIMKAGGGIGYNFGHLREEGAIVKSTGQTSGGPLSFMKSFDAMCDTVKQGGSRRGAMMGILPVWHPDIEKFIEMKADGKSFSNFNISVGMTDYFMHMVEQEHPDCKRIWNKIVEQAWKTGDPGLIFLDTINKAHPLEEDIEATNPCGEIPLRPYESCNLGSINLMAYLTHLGLGRDGDKDAFYSEPMFDWDALAKDIPTMVRFLDDIIDVNPFPLPEIEKATKESRKIGLGIMGWADCLIKMKIPYDSQEALDLAEKLMGFIYDKAEDASVELGIEKGAYPLHHGLKIVRRNATLLCVAPTGTLCRIAGVSSGIEPIFSWHTHHNLDGHEYDEVHWAYTEVANNHNGHFPLTPNKTYPWMKTANEIPWEWHLKMQAAFQKHVDNSISKTINLPTEATVEDIEFIYGTAWKIGLKGITIYRDKSKENQPLNKIEILMEEGYKKLAEESPWAQVIKPEYRKRGPVAVGVTHKVDTGKGKIYMTVNYSEYHQEPIEIFIRLGHAATPTEQSLAEFVGRLISVSLKHGTPLQAIIRQGNKIFSDNGFWYMQQSHNSLPRLICYCLGYTFGSALDKAELDINSFLDDPEEDGFCSTERLYEEGEHCYNCGTNGMIHEGGCSVCSNCGFERCG